MTKADRAFWRTRTRLWLVHVPGRFGPHIFTSPQPAFDMMLHAQYQTRGVRMTVDYIRTKTRS